MSKSQSSSNRSADGDRHGTRRRKSKVRVNILPDTYDVAVPPQPIAVVEVADPVEASVSVPAASAFPTTPDPSSLVFNVAAPPRRVAANAPRAASPWSGRVLWKLAYPVVGIVIFFTGMECGYFRAERRYDAVLSQMNRPISTTSETSFEIPKKAGDGNPASATNPAASAKKLEPLKPMPAKPNDLPMPARMTFAVEILPILKARCLVCHGGQAKKGDFDVRTVDALKEGGEHGPGIVPGNFPDSLLWKYIENDRMPPGRINKLSAEEKKQIRDWIADGAK